MPRPAEWCEHECEQLRAELAQTRIDAAKVIHALETALQTVDALLAWMPQGLTLSPEVSGCKERLDKAIQAVTGGHHK